MKVLMLVQSNVAGDSRILREVSALHDAGHEVSVIGRGVPDGFVAPHGVQVLSAGRPAGLGSAASRTSAPERVVRWLLLPEHRARVEAAWCRNAERLAETLPTPDVVHANDFNTLALGADLADRADAALVYDSHELWQRRERHGRPEPVRRWRQARLEDRLMARADAVLTVSEGIARRLSARGAPHVSVVRNTFPARGVPEGQIDRPRGLVYAGRIGDGRDLETVIGAASRHSLDTVIVGQSDASYVRGLHVGPTVRLTAEALSHDEIDRLYRENGIGLVTLAETCDNHRLALPNKLFHALRAGVPVIVSNLPEMAAFVAEHRVGVSYSSGDPDSLARAVAEVCEQYPVLRAHVEQAIRDGRFTWERDAAQLTEVYERIAASRHDR